MATLPRAPAPFVAPVAGTLEARLAQIAGAINRKADNTATPSYAGVDLVAPNGGVWRVTVDNTGHLVTTSVTR